MRIIGFSRMDWQDFIHQCPKLTKPEFSTFRWQRKDTPYYQNETVQVVLKPRTKTRLILGTAQIKEVEVRKLWHINQDEAREDGFARAWELMSYLAGEKRRRQLPPNHPLNRLILKWLDWYEPMILYARHKYEAITIYPVMGGVYKA